MDESPTKRAIIELMKLDGNGECADCGRKGELASLLAVGSVSNGEERR